jgi:hypothetical protein
MQDTEYFADLNAHLENGGYAALLYHMLHEVDLTGFNVRQVPQSEGLRHQRNQSLTALDSWWCELLETGTLTGADPNAPHRAVSNEYQRDVSTEHVNADGKPYTTVRQVRQLGLYDQARSVEPRLRARTSDHELGAFLKRMGCTNEHKVNRRRGWTFPPLLACRAAWEVRFPEWPWRDASIKNWRADDAAETNF